MRTATEVLGIAAAASVIAAALILVRLHLLRPELQPQRDAVGDYATGGSRLHYRAMVVLMGAGAGLLTAGMARQGDADALGLAFLAAFGAARILIAFFPGDPTGAPVTHAGRVHLVLAAVAFTAIAFGAADVTNAIDGAPQWSGAIAGPLRAEARAVAVTAALTIAALLIPLVRERVLGVVERLLYVTSLAWLVTVALHLAVISA
ncbi:MAG: putative rane protein [Solirubrobacteraceae bacterium]|nr:putative rane protein [Solirubrobacteraceae bacterium]